MRAHEDPTNSRGYELCAAILDLGGVLVECVHPAALSGGPHRGSHLAYVDADGGQVVAVQWGDAFAEATEEPR